MRSCVIRLVLAIGASYAFLPPVGYAETRQVFVSLQAFRVAGELSGDLSLTDDIWNGIDGPSTETKRTFTFFTVGRADLAGVRFVADETGWKWNDGEDILSPPKSRQPSLVDGKVSRLASPRVVTLLGTTASINFASQQTIEYFERLHDNVFELKTVFQPTGLSIDFMAEGGQAGRILLKDFTFSSQFVEDRKPIEGVSLNVGEPVIRKREFKVSMNLQPGRDYGILIHPPNTQGTLLLRLNAEYVPDDDKTKP